MRLVRVAAVQAEPKWLDLPAGVEQVIGYVDRAADGGAALVAFPETFLPGFPWGMWVNSVDWGGDFLARYLANALTADGPELRAVAYAARRKGIHVSIGFAERAGDAVFMSQALIDADGAIEIARKSEPTGLERTVFSTSDGGLLVRDTEFGRVGVLGGADHLRADLRARMHERREQIHVASWPGFTVNYGADQDQSRDLDAAAAVRYAMDGNTFVIAPVAVVPVTGWEVVDARTPDRRLLRGGGGVSRIFSPGGVELATPLGEGQAGLLFADLEMSGLPRPAAPAKSTPPDSRRDSPRPEVVEPA
ncbi:nitrilase-related carbon-nitrogen hydrolase [Nocardia lasii]|uniref:Nitrilase-related carbon-nitrogen hydrolase n=1 Tax=Nocardia lasii TaxID=1616107 RepID=A0ABW1JKE1_9NOCA